MSKRKELWQQMEWKIPLFDLNFGEAEKQAVNAVMDSKWISAGSKTAEFESRFAEMNGVQHAVAVNSGTAALHLAVLCLGIGPGDEVIVPSLTFAATANAVYYTGARPVFADVVSTNDLTIAPQDIEQKITPRTKAIMVMHYGGFACDMDAILAIADKYHLAVIEDAAHAPGATYKGKKTGTIGDVGAFSFFSNKNITTAEGGMLVTNNKDIANQARLLRSHGMTTSSYDRAQGHATKYDIRQVGFNYRLDDIRSAIGLVQLEKLAEDLRQRKALAGLYHRLLAGLAEITVPFAGKTDTSTNYIFPIVLNENCAIERDEFRARLEQVYGIQTSMHYPPVHKFTQYEDHRTVLPVTDYIVSHELTLPIYYAMTAEQVSYVCQSVRQILTGRGSR
jgi:dTDP-4-amino-4,6-dideoxygalactose transaminase